MIEVVEDVHILISIANELKDELLEDDAAADDDDRIDICT